MQEEIKLSVIIPVYNRPDEMKELLDSLSEQTFKDFELVVVEDGSSIKSEELCDTYRDRINISYFFKQNEGPSIGRNYGLARAKGNYYLFFDSDCILPPQYMQTINKELSENFVDCYGGPDGAMDDFSDFQKAVSYAMTSFFTTGGIRGGKKQVHKFHPRSFNLGFSKAVYKDTGGFPVTRMHPGEDMVFAIEVIKRGFETRLVQEAYVFHKRRVSFKKFYKQVFGFGKTRYIISKHYPETFKIFFLFPSLFALGTIGALLLGITVHQIFAFPVLLYAALVLADAISKSKSVKLGFLALLASYVQLFAYGIGFIDAIWKHKVLGKDEFGVFGKGFYE
ncbi:glycosyltransferase [Labilibaculum antarcticum]|uniref:Glycosyl transferase family 2 n=1 Tax=Labilibaculum antarcticum TaxID=1717717 RepID=A0A1Y1CKH3_9BACT|nr:glycosyltransferase [Labilibaculum antarcticum]BAX80886.1 glycosyl transferase family 2 [Labilibaculum antarcticum]